MKVDFEGRGRGKPDLEDSEKTESKLQDYCQNYGQAVRLLALSI